MGSILSAIDDDEAEVTDLCKQFGVDPHLLAEDKGLLDVLSDMRQEEAKLQFEVNKLHRSHLLTLKIRKSALDKLSEEERLALLSF